MTSFRDDVEYAKDVSTRCYDEFEPGEIVDRQRHASSSPVTTRSGGVPAWNEPEVRGSANKTPETNHIRLELPVYSGDQLPSDVIKDLMKLVDRSVAPSPPPLQLQQQETWTPEVEKRKSSNFNIDSILKSDDRIRNNSDMKRPRDPADDRKQQTFELINDRLPVGKALPYFKRQTIYHPYYNAVNIPPYFASIYPFGISRVPIVIPDFNDSQIRTASFADVCGKFSNFDRYQSPTKISPRLEERRNRFPLKRDSIKQRIFEQRSQQLDEAIDLRIGKNFNSFDEIRDNSRETNRKGDQQSSPSSLSSVSTSSSSSSTSPSTKASGDPNTTPKLPWPAWVYCTRYSDRPSAGERNIRNMNEGMRVMRFIKEEGHEGLGET